jgi:carbonic anhydrase/acetyltransferase-like protein (isoleucine patch superfamily)
MTIEDFEGFSPVISPSAWVHESAVVIGQVEIGDECSIWPNANLRADEGSIQIGAKSNIQDGTTVHMTGGLSVTRVGERVTVGHNCILHGCVIEDDVLIGMGTIVMDNAVVGTGSYIGAGTLITAGKVIPPNSLVFGNPMQIKRATSEKEVLWIQYAWEHYVKNSRKYLSRGS